MSDCSPEAKTPRLSPRGFAEAVVVALPLGAFFSAGWAHRWIADDGFIYLRVVRQIRTGHGPVFNAGERVEAFTSPLWVAVLSVADVVTPDASRVVGRRTWPHMLGRRVGLAGRGVAGARAPGHADRVPRSLRPARLRRPLARMGVSDERPRNGADVRLGRRMSRDPRASGHAPACAASVAVDAIVLGLGWLVRPELALFSVVFLLVVLAGQWRADDAPNRARLIAAMFALPFIYQVFRMGYYGSLVANTAVAKEGTQLRWDRGWSYFADFARPYWLWLAALALVLGGYLPLIGALRQQRATPRSAGRRRVRARCGARRDVCDRGRRRLHPRASPVAGAVCVLRPDRRDTDDAAPHAAVVVVPMGHRLRSRSGRRKCGSRRVRVPSCCRANGGGR